MSGQYDDLVRDLIRRTEAAVEQVARTAVDTGITFQLDDVVQVVEDGLPMGYPSPTVGATTRRDMIQRMARDILDGSIYDDGDAS